MPVAKQRLGVSRIWWQISTRTVEPVRNAAGEVGVSLGSLEREVE